jgi:hypothetical protein
MAPGKASAVVTYPDEATATAAVGELHGVKVEGKALIVVRRDGVDAAGALVLTLRLAAATSCDAEFPERLATRNSRRLVVSTMLEL